MAETGLMLRRVCGLAGQSPNSKEPEPCPWSQSRLDGSVTGQREGNDYQGTRPCCFQMAQPGGKCQPTLGEHKHHRGRKGTDSPGMRGHDPQTRPTAEQQPTLAGSGKVARRLSKAPETCVAIVGNGRKKKLQNIQEGDRSRDEMRLAKLMQRRQRRWEPANYRWDSGGGAAPTEIPERKGSQGDRAGEHGPHLATA